MRAKKQGPVYPVIHEGKTARIVEDKDPSLSTVDYLDLPADYDGPKTGVVEYYVEKRERTLSGDIRWTTEAVFGSPIQDPALRSDAYAAAAKMVAAIDEREAVRSLRGTMAMDR